MTTLEFSHQPLSRIRSSREPQFLCFRFHILRNLSHLLPWPMLRITMDRSRLLATAPQCIVSFVLVLCFSLYSIANQCTFLFRLRVASPKRYSVKVKTCIFTPLSSIACYNLKDGSHLKLNGVELGWALVGAAPGAQTRFEFSVWTVLLN